MDFDDDDIKGPPCLVAALFYASQGWPVFPCHSVNDSRCSCGDSQCSRPGKHPRTVNGLSDATTDQAKIVAWWERWPDASVAVRTGTVGTRCLVVVDVDVNEKKGKHGDETWTRLVLEHGAPPESPMCLTGGGGMHFFFWSSTPIPCSQGRIGDSIDIRGEGGYVIAVPSTHESGRNYQWESSAHALDVPLAELPAWIAAAAGTVTSERATIPSPQDSFGEGGRNAALAALAGRMRRGGFNQEAITSALLIENRTRCNPPLDDKEVEKIAWSISRYEPRDPIRASSSPATSPDEEWFPSKEGAEIDEDLPPVSWISRELRLAPGVTLVAGQGFGGKTVFLQALAMAVASGQDALGRFSVRQGRVGHIDYEGGEAVTLTKYRRLGRAMSIPFDGLPLSVSCLPKRRLDADGGLDALKRWCDGMSLLILDAFRGAFPSVDENSSTVRNAIDDMQRVSESTGTAMLVIAHATKSIEGTSRSKIRGSGALVDAAQTVFFVESLDNGTARIECIKERVSGKKVATFGMSIEDRGDTDLDPLCPLDVKWFDSATIIEPDDISDSQVMRNVASLDALVARIVSFVRSGGEGGCLYSTLLAACQRSQTDTRAAVYEAVRLGLLMQDGKGMACTLYAIK